MAVYAATESPSFNPARKTRKELSSLGSSKPDYLYWFASEL